MPDRVSELAPGAITDVAGLSVGHAAAAGRPTGCTVVLCPQGATCGVDVRGGAPGTRETELLRPQNTVQQVHAVLLTGGCAFGLDAAGGVMRWLEERGHGLPVGQPAADGTPTPRAVTLSERAGEHTAIVWCDAECRVVAWTFGDGGRGHRVTAVTLLRRGGAKSD